MLDDLLVIESTGAVAKLYLVSLLVSVLAVVAPILAGETSVGKDSWIRSSALILAWASWSLGI